MNTTEILRNLSEQVVSLASLVRQLIAAKSEDAATIEMLKAQALQYLEQYNSLVASQGEELEVATNLKSEVEALIVEASAAIAQPVV